MVLNMKSSLLLVQRNTSAEREIAVTIGTITEATTAKQKQQ